jgi:Putative restriction endonuclease
MADTAFKRATYQDILDLPEGVVGEIIKGVLHSKPRPRVPHVRVALKLVGKVAGPFDTDDDGPGGWLFLQEVELHLGQEIVVPDMAGWKRERFPGLANDAFLTVPPDWVCEILSPSTAQKDRALKANIYASEGVGYMWLIDPQLKTLEAYKNHSGQWLQLGVITEGAEVKIEPFDAAPFKLDTLWT